MKKLLYLLSCLLLAACSVDNAVDHPNVIMIMCDDLGYGDTGFNGNKVVRTPHLDEIASKGIIFNRFYTASPVCSPTRASCLTGRNPFRMNIPNANSGHMKTEEVTIAEILRRNKYRTGHFGKWHLGTLTTKITDSNRGRPGNFREFSIPSQHGFDEFFSTEAKVPTFDPMLKPKRYDEKIGESPRFGWAKVVEADSAEEFGTYYWNGKEKRVTTDLEGDNSKVIMDRALEFIERHSGSKKPFFTVIWLHTPHLPVVSDEEYRAQYQDLGFKEQLYYGSISAMDEQVGRLWQKLVDLEEADNTMLWFCSDNGPENGTPGSSGQFRERKGSLYEGGLRVPAFVVWPQKFEDFQKIDFPVMTSDYLPTILDLLDIKHQLARPMDGMSIVTALDGFMHEREKPMGFLFRSKRSWMTHQYKLISVDDGENYELYDLLKDPQEEQDISASNAEIVSEMKEDLLTWIESVNDSRTGGDY